MASLKTILVISLTWLNICLSTKAMPLADDRSLDHSNKSVSLQSDSKVAAPAIDISFAEDFGSDTTADDERAYDIYNMDDLGKRQTQQNPIVAYLNCTNFPEVCDTSCFAILCGDKPSLLQRDDNADVTHDNRQDAGTLNQPFVGTPQQLDRRGLSIPDDNHLSAEEYPFASTNQGGDGACVFPVRTRGNNRQGASIRQMYRAYNVQPNDWFQLEFENYGGSPYCNALYEGNYDVCDQRIREPWGFDFGYYVYTKDSLPNQVKHFSYLGKY